MSKVFFLSDLHLGHLDEDIFAKEIIFWLKKTPKSGDIIVFAGDIFHHFWGSNSEYISLYEEFFMTLQSLTNQKIEIHWLEGNHDRRIQKLKNFGIKIHKNYIHLDLFGRKIHVEHGDRVIKDFGYFVLKTVRDFFLTNIIFKFIRVKYLEKFASIFSRPYKDLELENFEIPLEWIQEKNRIFNAGFDIIVIGHFHAEWFLEEKSQIFINIGLPRISKKILVLDSVSKNVQRMSL